LVERRIGEGGREGGKEGRREGGKEGGKDGGKECAYLVLARDQAHIDRNRSIATLLMRGEGRGGKEGKEPA